MAKDPRDLLDVLKAELRFIEEGGYSRNWQRPWIPASFFEDSPSCLGFGHPERPPKCENCVLFELVPVLLRGETIPCHHIPLNEHGETVYTMERQNPPSEVEAAVRTWLSYKIYEIEKRKARDNPN